MEHLIEFITIEHVYGNIQYHIMLFIIKIYKKIVTWKNFMNNVAIIILYDISLQFPGKKFWNLFHLQPMRDHKV